MRILEGGSGSGNFGHSGRPHQIGGSSKFGVQDLIDAYNILDDNQKRFVDAWSDTEFQNYAGFNKYLRTGHLDNKYFDSISGPRQLRYYEDAQKVLDSSFKPLPTDVIAYRAASKVMDFKKGDTFADKGYVSTTLSDKIAFERFGVPGFVHTSTSFVMYRIHLKKGQKFIGIPNNEEQELLLPRGSQFKVLRKSYNTKDYFTPNRYGSLGNEKEVKLYHTAVIYDLEVIQ